MISILFVLMFVPFLSLISQDVKDSIPTLIDKAEKDIDTLRHDIRDIKIEQKLIDDQIRYKDSLDNINK